MQRVCVWNMKRNVSLAHPRIAPARCTAAAVAAVAATAAVPIYLTSIAALRLSPAIIYCRSKSQKYHYYLPIHISCVFSASDFIPMLFIIMTTEWRIWLHRECFRDWLKQIKPFWDCIQWINTLKTHTLFIFIFTIHAYILNSEFSTNHFANHCILAQNSNMFRWAFKQVKSGMNLIEWIFQEISIWSISIECVKQNSQQFDEISIFIHEFKIQLQREISTYAKIFPFQMRFYVVSFFIFRSRNFSFEHLIFSNFSNSITFNLNSRKRKKSHPKRSLNVTNSHSICLFKRLESHVRDFTRFPGPFFFSPYDKSSGTTCVCTIQWEKSTYKML